MSEFVQIEKDVLYDILNRVSYLRKTLMSIYERVRNKEPDDWLTLSELCEMLQISPSKANSLKKGGRIGFTKCGKITSILQVMPLPYLKKLNETAPYDNDLHTR